MMKAKHRSLLATCLLLTTVSLVGCEGEQVGTDNGEESQATVQPEEERTESRDRSLWSRWTSELTQETSTVPEGKEIRVHLEEAISSTGNASGDSFRARLVGPLTFDNKLLAPADSVVVGELSHVQSSGRVNRQAEMTLTLRELLLGDEKYSVSTHPLTIRAEKTTKKDAAIIGGSSAVGAVVGAVTGGKKGAAIGAGLGAAGGTGYVLATSGKEVEFGIGTQFAFTLKDPLKLPVRKET